MAKTSTKKSAPVNSQPAESQLQEQLTLLEADWKRALADYQNLLRRVENDKREFTKISNANLIARLLPALDIIELSASHSQDIGVQMAAKQFHEALSGEGLEVIVPESGAIFDPLLHECSDTIAGQPENTIAELVLKGYKINDYVLRPAKVKVYKNLIN